MTLNCSKFKFSGNFALGMFGRHYCSMIPSGIQFACRVISENIVKRLYAASIYSLETGSDIRLLTGDLQNNKFHSQL